MSGQWISVLIERLKGVLKSSPVPEHVHPASSDEAEEVTQYRTGLNLLYPGSGSVLTVDIVAVHGLNGKPFETWTANSRLWLRDFLPEAIPSARIFTFGYTADVFSRNDMDILDCANALLAGLETSRTEGDELRPLILIGHSLGGLVIKMALLEAKERSNPTWDAVRNGGVMFMAVPHGGAAAANLAANLANIANLYAPTNTTMLRQLNLKSPGLYDLSRRFGTLQKELRLVSVLEAGRTPIPKSMRGSIQVVEDTEARLNLGESEYKIDGSDHRTVCKFDDARHPQYLLVENSLKQLAKPPPQSATRT
ncbi:hypothetical protein J4E81_007965 [Alternaria sp. BMP 2799]|nr:hypothetical protein J4E81_007965 [Alternaria sp. BMP 2799]